jgi:FlaA1/EpsC-like NDP-sugar epimerase
METLHRPEGQEWIHYLVAGALAPIVFSTAGLYRAVFRYFSTKAMLQTVRAVLWYAMALVAFHWLQIWPKFPLTLGLMQPIIFLLLLGAVRITAQYWLVNRSAEHRPAPRRLLIYGAGEAGVQMSSAMAVTRAFKVVGFVDDAPHKRGQTINGAPVFSASAIDVVVSDLAVTDVLLAMPSVSRVRRNQIVQRLGTLPVHTRTLPRLSELATGRVTVQDLRELDVEDLLGREPVAPDPVLLAKLLHEQVVLVTGAGGTIGSELSRQILRERPHKLLLLDHSEYGLYCIHRELEQWREANAPSIELVPLLVSVTNRRRLDAILGKYRPSIIYHAAAYKHVPMLESNPSEGIVNNVFGTLALAHSAIALQVPNFVLVSTDKAVRPTNLMGASKRVAELVLQALANQGDAHSTCFSMVRFGNVLGSSGSVVPMFRDQLEAGGPLTVTHPEVTRYFMTIPEAAQLVLQAAAMATGGEVFLLDMGEPVKIVDLARRLVSLAGLRVKDAQQPDGDIELQFIGLRPGEKLYEELLIVDNPIPTSHARIMKAREDCLEWADLDILLGQLQQAALNEDLRGIQAVLKECVHGYLPDAR